MSTTHAKLYSTKRAWTTAKNNLERAIGIPTPGTPKYCEEEQVRSDHPDHANKWILPIETGGQFATKDLVTGEIAYDWDWYPAPPDPFEE